MTLDLDAIERAALAATEGPWHRNIRPVTHYPTVYAGRNTHVLQIVTRSVSAEQAEANCEFVIAASPSAVLALVREVRELRAEREKSLAPLREWLEGLRTIKFCGGGTVPLYRRMLTLMRAALAGDPT